MRMCGRPASGVLCAALVDRFARSGARTITALPRAHPSSPRHTGSSITGRDRLSRFSTKFVGPRRMRRSESDDRPQPITSHARRRHRPVDLSAHRSAPHMTSYTNRFRRRIEPQGPGRGRRPRATATVRPPAAGAGPRRHGLLVLSCPVLSSYGRALISSPPSSSVSTGAVRAAAARVAQDTSRAPRRRGPARRRRRGLHIAMSAHVSRVSIYARVIMCQCVSLSLSIYRGVARARPSPPARVPPRGPVPRPSRRRGGQWPAARADRRHARVPRRFIAIGRARDRTPENRDDVAGSRRRASRCHHRPRRPRSPCERRPMASCSARRFQDSVRLGQPSLAVPAHRGGGEGRALHHCIICRHGHPVTQQPQPCLLWLAAARGTPTQSASSAPASVPRSLPSHPIIIIIVTIITTITVITDDRPVSSLPRLISSSSLVTA